MTENYTTISKELQEKIDFIGFEGYYHKESDSLQPHTKETYEIYLKGYLQVLNSTLKNVSDTDIYNGAFFDEKSNTWLADWSNNDKYKHSIYIVLKNINVS